ncbi:MAG: hypothetical protein J6X44_03875 [Thermoguttaceae bacterium]|nr:hypothetical protein [Thermoguttaceae bacterium]
MFDINEFLNAPCVDETHVVEHGSEAFRIRRLDGSERLRYNDLSTEYERVRFALARGLTSGSENVPIGEENAARLIERSGALADALFCDIFDLTQESLRKEREIWREVKKK